MSSSQARFYLLWLSAGCCEAPVVLFLLGESVNCPPFLIFALHLVQAPLLFFAAPKEKGWFRLSRHWLEPFLLWPLFFPGFGWLLVGLYGHLMGRRAWSTTLLSSLDEWKITEPETKEPEEFRMEEHSSQIHELVDIAPAVDLLFGEDVSLKRGAIQSLAKIRTPQAIEWIVRARTDPDPDVRFSATQTLTYLKRDYEQQLKASEQDIYENPTQRQPRISLAQVQYDYALSGLADSIRKKLLLSQAYQELSQMEEAPDSLQLLYRVERELNPRQSLERLNQLIRLVPQARTQWIRERVVLLFELAEYQQIWNDMAELEETVQTNRKQESLELDLKWKSALFWWRNV